MAAPRRGRLPVRPTTAFLAPAPRRPRLALVVGLVVLLAFGGWTVWRHLQQPAGPAGMASATVIAQHSAGERVELVLRYQAEGRSYTARHGVDAAAFREQGKVAWICFERDDPGPDHTRVRLPLDPLC